MHILSKIGNCIDWNLCKNLKEYPLSLESQFDVDYIGEIVHFRVYENDVKSKSVKYLVDCDFKELSDVLLKIVPLSNN
ncbi:MAG: hypothetical protein Q9M40_02290 [Sulfurimonas sp.]|nr:hypothetical protein [Sulfurimonas sp.]